MQNTQIHNSIIQIYFYSRSQFPNTPTPQRHQLINYRLSCDRFLQGVPLLCVLRTLHIYSVQLALCRQFLQLQFSHNKLLLYERSACVMSFQSLLNSSKHISTQFILVSKNVVEASIVALKNSRNKQGSKCLCKDTAARKFKHILTLLNIGCLYKQL